MRKPRSWLAVGLSIGLLALAGLLPTQWSVDSATALASGGPTFQGRLRSAIGTNLESLAYWSPQMPFVDVMKSSGEWLSGDAKDWDGGPRPDLDANGWVRSLRPGQVVRKLMLREFGSRYPGGRYLVRYKGEGKLNFGFAAKVASQRRGEMVIEVTPNDAGVYLWIEATNPANYLREIEIIMPGGICEGDPFTHAGSAQDCGTRRFVSFAEDRSIIFYPVFAERLRGYSVLRFMDWMRTNSSAVASWSQRTPLTYHTWATDRGAPLEVMIALANLVEAHAWFTLPHQADESYARALAQMVKDRLNPALGVYVEDSNEVWNSEFSQYAYLSNQAKAQGLTLPAYHALRTRTLAAVLKSELGAERVVSVLGAQAANPRVATSGLEYLRARFGASALGIDALAIAPYFGVTPAPAEAGKFTAMSLDALSHYVRTNVFAQETAHVRNHRMLAQRYGLRLLAYEGGQHMVGVGGSKDNRALNALFDAFNRDPRMKPLYLEYLALWRREGGELFVHFNDVSRYTKSGRWGALEYVTQPRSESPKFDALMTFIEQNPPWWSH